MSKKFEQYAPLVSAIIFVCVAFYCGINVAVISNFDQILNAIINITAILLGFLAAMMSILIVSASKRVIKLLKECNLIDCFNGYFKCTVVVGILSAVSSVILLGISNIASPNIFYVWLFLNIWFMASAARILYIMLQIFSSVLRENN
ncbi:hypothetical protein [Phascolarctobacterium faecium]|jgi:hypothetical protein|uniref:hypothetical protein n=1 Tax=Phascolarctobacterium faecium TaxID=33025 RepID=UPI0020496231|nr:hypothetical protein [Phascolarctobacterium faecium]DAJ94615.1 MAG TPA: hypothetical protein [Caudoviricetes sp.]